MLSASTLLIAQTHELTLTLLGANGCMQSKQPLHRQPSTGSTATTTRVVMPRASFFSSPKKSKSKPTSQAPKWVYTSTTTTTTTTQLPQQSEQTATHDSSQSVTNDNDTQFSLTTQAQQVR
jgi:hypothetical protein